MLETIRCISKFGQIVATVPFYTRASFDIVWYSINKSTICRPPKYRDFLEIKKFHLMYFKQDLKNTELEQQMEEPLEDKWQVVAELRSILAIAGIPMKSRTVNALVEIIDARPNVSVDALVAVLEELKKIKTYSVLINR